MRVAVHQPEYLPCLRLLLKAARADTLVLLDDAQFNRESLQHRARIWSGGGLRWLTIPFVHAFPQPIADVRVADDGWRARHRAALREAYREAPGFPAAMAAVEALLDAPYARVADAAIASMAVLFRAFGLAPRLIRSSTLGVAGHRNELVLGLCQRLQASTYVCGLTAARTYLDREAFAAAGVAVQVPEPTAPDDAWADGLSGLHTWMRLGADARKVLT